MSLSDILGKIDNQDGGAERSRSGQGSGYGFVNLMDDIRLLLDNASLYNAVDSYEVKQARKLENAFVRLCRDSITDSVVSRRLRNLFKSAQR